MPRQALLSLFVGIDQIVQNYLSDKYIGKSMAYSESARALICWHL